MNLKNELKTHFGFDIFLQGQEDVISRVLAGESAGAIFPTGAGKSLCYQLPAVLLPHMTLVVSPLLSLMKDQMDFLLSHNVQAARLDSTLSSEEYNNIISRAQAGNLKILMISV
ncbi:MAG: DEAD/DEAH box helicase, partial [Spirochaetaceae bacterium]|nr:DEAD/DEAH box helicase [Spirochaetaceae bacterium]